MSIFKNRKIGKLSALCIGLICIIGCGRTNIRETDNKEVSRREADIKEPDMREVKRAEANTWSTVMKEADRKETDMRKIVTKEAGISSRNLVEVPDKEETDKEKDSDKPSVHYDEVGIASFISDEYEGKMTASGIRYDRNQKTAAHASLPFDTKILITNLRNRKKVEVVIIDRFSPTKDRILNVSHNAAVELDLVESGIAKVGLQIITRPEKD